MIYNVYHNVRGYISQYDWWALPIVEPYPWSSVILLILFQGWLKTCRISSPLQCGCTLLHFLDQLSVLYYGISHVELPLRVRL